MKRLIIPVAAAAMMVLGCQESNSTTSNQPTKTDSAKTAMSTEGHKTASTAKPASAKEYYEVKKNGKIYVFGNVDDMLNFRSSGALPGNMIEKPATGPNGETVVYQGGGMEAGLMAEYAKAHPKK